MYLVIYFILISIEVFAGPTPKFMHFPSIDKTHNIQIPKQKIATETADYIAVVNTSVPRHAISDHFISLAFDPLLIPDLPWADSKLLTLARELSPAWFKIASTSDKKNKFNLTINHWAAVNHFTSSAGMKQMWNAKLFSSIAKIWKSNDYLELIKNTKEIYSSKFEFPTPSNQIGFSIMESEEDYLQLIKNAIAQYNDPAVMVSGPDTLFFTTVRQIEHFAQWLVNNSATLSFLSWHPSKLNIPRYANATNVISPEYSDLFKVEQAVIHNVAARIGLGNKPIWIDDSSISWNKLQPSLSPGTFGSTMLWLDRICSAAASNVDVILHPNLLPFHKRGLREEPSSEYWVAVLFKRLLGTHVLDVQSRCEGSSPCRLYSHCTPSHAKTRYLTGAVTVVGINMYHTTLQGHVTNFSSCEKYNEVHEYVFTANNFTDRDIFLNNVKLVVDAKTGFLPSIEPKIISTPAELVMPPFSMVFWVFPNAMSKACGYKNDRETRSIFDDSTSLSMLFPINNQKEKRKRCYDGITRSNGQILTRNIHEECPAGCHPSNNAQCDCSGTVSVVTTGLAANKILQRLMSNLNLNKYCCCCDNESSTPAYETGQGEKLRANEDFTMQNLNDSNYGLNQGEFVTTTQYPAPFINYGTQTTVQETATVESDTQNYITSENESSIMPSTSIEKSADEIIEKCKEIIASSYFSTNYNEPIKEQDINVIRHDGDLECCQPKYEPNNQAVTHPHIQPNVYSKQNDYDHGFADNNVLAVQGNIPGSNDRSKSDHEMGYIDRNANRAPHNSMRHHATPGMTSLPQNLHPQSSIYYKSPNHNKHVYPPLNTAPNKNIYSLQTTKFNNNVQDGQGIIRSSHDPSYYILKENQNIYKGKQIYGGPSKINENGLNNRGNYYNRSPSKALGKIHFQNPQDMEVKDRTAESDNNQNINMDPNNIMKQTPTSPLQNSDPKIPTAYVSKDDESVYTVYTPRDDNNPISLKNADNMDKERLNENIAPYDSNFNPMPTQYEYNPNMYSVFPQPLTQQGQYYSKESVIWMPEEECIIRCSGKRLCQKDNLYQFVSNLLKQFSNVKCSEFGYERPYIHGSVNNGIIELYQPSFVACPSECATANPCTEAKLAMALKLWLQQCFTKYQF